jgi:hypothetical protein
MKNFVFKGTVSQDFWPSVFSYQTIPPRALIHELKPFCIWLCICQKIVKLFSKFGFHHVNETAGSDLEIFVKDYAVSMRLIVSLKLRHSILWCQWQHGIRSQGVNDTTGLDPTDNTTGSDPVVLRASRDQIPRLQWHRVIASRGVKDTVEIFMKLKNHLWKMNIGSHSNKKETIAKKING